jgi:polyphenol oxidase
MTAPRIGSTAGTRELAGIDRYRPEKPHTNIGPVARLEERGDLEVLAWPDLERLGLDAVVTTRTGGVSVGPYESLNLGLHVGDDPDAVLENRRRAAAVLGASLDGLVFGQQVHGARASVVGPAERGRGARDQSDALADTDSLVTTDKGTVLVTLVADCVPVLLFDPQARVLACAHAGWRGALSGVLEETIAVMRSLGASADRMVAAIGPAVATERYQVGAEVFAAARAVLGRDVSALAPPDGSGRWLLDLTGVVRCLLERAGVEPASCLVTPYVTGDQFFSDRAARPCGRFGLLARIAP